jgi:hypothetical protein
MTMTGFGQAAYVQPSPTGADEEMTLYIDISQSVDGTSNNALQAILTDHPDEDVYLWAWQPAGPVDGNGEWAESNEAMKLDHISGLLYSKTFIATEFFNVDGSTLFQNGISCLAKLKDGNAFDGQYDGEAKTEDLHVDIIPKLCDKKWCVFPEIAEPDDFVSFSYDNNQEVYEDLMDINEGEAYVYLSARTGPFTTYPYVDLAMVTSTDELQLQPVDGEPGFFRITFVPSELWSDLIPEEEEISEIIYYVLKPGFTYPGAPPQQTYTTLLCE